MKIFEQLNELLNRVEGTIDKADKMLSQKVLEEIKSKITFK